MGGKPVQAFGVGGTVVLSDYFGSVDTALGLLGKVGIEGQEPVIVLGATLERDKALIATLNAFDGTIEKVKLLSIPGQDVTVTPNAPSASSGRILFKTQSDAFNFQPPVPLPNRSPSPIRCEFTPGRD